MTPDPVSLIYVNRLPRAHIIYSYRFRGFVVAYSSLACIRNLYPVLGVIIIILGFA